MRKSICILAILMMASDLFAAVPANNEIARSGKVVGGEAGRGFSLLKVSERKMKNRERWVLDIGNVRGEVHKGKPGYYHVELNSAEKTLSIDLAQLHLNKVEQKQLASLIRSSAYLAKGEIKSDASDQSLNLAFQLKKPVKVKVYQVAGVKGTSRVVFDLFE